jgi:hypothetical protein
MGECVLMRVIYIGMKKHKRLFYIVITAIVFCLIITISVSDKNKLLWFYQFNSRIESYNSQYLFSFNNSKYNNIDEKVKYSIKDSYIIEKKGSKENVLLRNVTNVTQVRLGPDGKTLHFKVNFPDDINTYNTHYYCVDLDSDRTHVSKDHGKLTPPWDYKELYYSKLMPSCGLNGKSGGFLKNSGYFVYIKYTSDLTKATLVIEDIKTSYKYSFSLPSVLVQKISGDDYIEKIGIENWYVYPSKDIITGEEKLVMAFGNYVLAYDLNDNKMLGWDYVGGLEYDIVEDYFWFHGKKDSDLIVIESKWEWWTRIEGIVDVSNDRMKVVSLKEYSEQVNDWYELEEKQIIWEKNKVLLNFYKFKDLTEEETKSLVGDKYIYAEDPPDSAMSIEKSLELARTYERAIKGSGTFIGVNCYVFNIYPACYALVEKSTYIYSPGGILEKINN